MRQLKINKVTWVMFGMHVHVRGRCGIYPGISSLYAVCKRNPLLLLTLCCRFNQTFFWTWKKIQALLLIWFKKKNYSIYKIKVKKRTWFFIVHWYILWKVKPMLINLFVPKLFRGSIFCSKIMNMKVFQCGFLYKKILNHKFINLFN